MGSEDSASRPSVATVVVVVFSGSPSSSPSPASPKRRSSTSSMSGAVIGGVFAGALVIAAILAIWFMHRRRRRVDAEHRNRDHSAVQIQEKAISPYGSPISPSQSPRTNLPSRYDDTLSEVSTIRGTNYDVESGLRSPPPALSRLLIPSTKKFSRPTSLANSMAESDSISMFTSTTGELEHDRKVQNIKRAEMREKRRELAMQSLREDDCREY